MASVSFFSFPYRDFGALEPGQATIHRYSENHDEDPPFTWINKVVSVSVLPFNGVIGAPARVSMVVERVTYSHEGVDVRYIDVLLRNTGDRFVPSYTVVLGVINKESE